MTENSTYLKSIVTKLRSIVTYKIYNSDETDSDFNSLLITNDLSAFYAKSIVGDGNCLYRAISFLLLGTQEYFYVIKVCSIFIMLEYSEYFEHILKYNHRKEMLAEFVVKVAKTNEWANEINIVSITVLLSRTLYSFSMDSTSHRPARFRFTIKESGESPIMIALHNNHFVPLLKVCCFA